MLKKLLVALLSGIILLSGSASAISDAVIDHADAVDTYYYNPEGSLKCTSNYASDISVYGGAIEEKIWAGLTSFLTPEQAAGVLGNLQSESGLNPARHETSAINKYQPGFDLMSSPKVAYGLGLGQWSYSRRIRLYGFIKGRAPELTTYLDDYQTYGRLSGSAFLEKAGESVADQLISLEIEYLRDELTSAYSGFFQTNTVEEATAYFLEHFEVPKNPTLSAHPERLTQAETFYTRYSGSSIKATTSKSGDLNCTNSSSLNSTGDVGSLQSLVLEYAWDHYHQAPFTERKPAYAEAVAKRVANGQYVGGSVDGAAGIDCGGFVTTLMQESGFAPNYNAGGGNTAAQESWVKANGWQLLNANEHTAVNTSLLQPGDVAFTTGHTFVYVGDIPGFDSKIASASYSSSADEYARAPMAGRESLTYGNNTTVRWYRKP
ncbi:hypothetical protein IJ090_03075 [Candidatus Saccharibacteria bacterium]|nr:hypothetical protein [Candidatus Saccharibacteria bacterium]